MHYSTGLSKRQTDDLFTLVEKEFLAGGSAQKFPPILGLFESMLIAVRYLRTNHTETEIAETIGVSQATVSRAITALTPLLERALARLIPVAEDVDLTQSVIIDGTLLPCWTWKKHPELFSGKHKTTGYNVQVACDLTGRVLWVSDPVDGRRHDTAALAASGLLTNQDTRIHLGDKGYQGTHMITPIKKLPGQDLHESEKLFNKQVNKLRYVVERGIAHLKNWKALHTDYRRPLNTFAATITAAIGLYFLTALE